MYISLDWISDYVDLDGLLVDDIVSRLTLSTAEVEGVLSINRFTKGVVVGEVTSIENLGANLNFCNVNCGGQNYVTVCGAPNVKLGLKAPFAPVGTTLADGRVVESANKHGKTSQGILCSAAELGMSTWHEIVLEIPNNIPNGTHLDSLIPDSDTLIEIDNKSLTHRPDLWGHYGFAREFSVIFKRQLKPLPLTDLSQFDKLPAYKLQNCDYENCPAYGCIEFQTCGVVPSPLFIQRRLHALGMRSYNLLVDVTNYVNWEIGQPTHAFDADKLGGIKVAVSGEAAKFVTLDNQVRNILPEDLFIWGSTQSPEKNNQQIKYRPVALAGVMGGAETEVTDSTTKILLESANFKAARIRRTSGRLDLRTDASQRYEKTQPPSNVKIATARILKLIDDAGAELKVLSRFTLDGDLQDKTRDIILPAKRLEQLAGISIPQEQITNILNGLGFNSKLDTEKNLIVSVPAFRSTKDISIQEDIVEEVLRIYGYDNIPPVMPTQPIRPLFVEKQIKIEHKIQKLLAAAHRFFEVHNYIWFNDTWLNNLGFQPHETLILKNPTTPETTRLRTTLIPNLLALIPKNRPFRDSFRLFEIGRVFFPTGKNQECREEHHLAGVAFKQSASGNSLEDFYLSIKSAVEDIFTVCGIGGIRFADADIDGKIDTATHADKKIHADKDHTDKDRADKDHADKNHADKTDVNKAHVDKAHANKSSDIIVTKNTLPVWYSRGSAAQILAGGEVVGSIGVLDKNVMSRILPEGGGVVWFEILLDKLNAVLFPDIKFIEPPRYPLSWQDFSLVWSVEKGFDKLESTLDQFNNPLIVKREFLVSYKGKGIEKGMASHSFRYWIGAADRTLTGDDIEQFHKQFLTFLAGQNIALRN